MSNLRLPDYIQRSINSLHEDYKPKKKEMENLMEPIYTSSLPTKTVYSLKFPREGDLLDLRLIPEYYINEEGDVDWGKIEADAEAVRLAKKVTRGQMLISHPGKPEHVPYLDN